MSEASRIQLIEYARKMNRSGINQGTSGNLSVRRDDWMLITPSAVPYDDLEPADIVQVNFRPGYINTVRFQRIERP